MVAFGEVSGHDPDGILVEGKEARVEPMAARMENDVRIIEADLDNPEHQRDILAMTLAYARDAMGGGASLPDEVQRNLICGLKAMPTAHIFLACMDEQPVGIATCFLGFSTFKARPLLNIHDFAVLPEYRKRGIGRRLLEAVTVKAGELGCCKLTLEVVEHNNRAKKIYETAGFTPALGGMEKGPMLFYTKIIS
jgi:ribosomal protein S18 acetylase RimI-like enzyme